MSSLKNKIVFITGASSGIGKACAEVFAGEKSNLILAARRIEKLNELSKTLTKKYKIKIKTLQLDVRSLDDVKNNISSLEKQWKSIDVLINNAGLARGFSKVYEGDTNEWEEMIDTNIKGLLFITRQILPLMVKRKKGHIINIGSTAGHEVYLNGNVYCATKFAEKALSQSIRLDVLDKNIKVSSVDPGLVETEFSIVRFSGDKNRAKNVYAGLKPLKAVDIANSILFCATRPPHVNINEIIVTPSAQASSTNVYRKQKNSR
jgi:serine 3-dehydrogenase